MLLSQGKQFSDQQPRFELSEHSKECYFCVIWPLASGPLKAPEAWLRLSNGNGTGEHFGFDVTSLKVSQIELKSLQKGYIVLTQYPV